MSNDNVSAVPTVTLDGDTYAVTEFGNEVQQLVGIRNLWGNQLNEERLTAAKTEAALRQLDVQLELLIKKELAEKAKPEDEPKAKAKATKKK